MRTDEPFELTVLGSATPYPAPDNPCSGYLLSHADTRIWVDAGTGTLGALRAHVPLDRVDAIWISHLHADHCADLLTAYYGALHADLRLDAPIPLFAPPGTADRLADFLTHTPRRSPVEQAFAVVESTDGATARVGSLTLTTRAVEHGMPAFALRAETPDGRSFVHSGDTAPCPALTALARDCDLLLCEADTATDTPPDPTGPPPVHHTPEQAGHTATAAGARALLLTHLGHPLTPADAKARAARTYGGPIDWAAPGAVFPVTGPVTGPVA
ncbi:MBL fold metallo-hydrolase (plasmid) [Streptomyces sp. BI20]|uniref:MBL fold metallo-hydrolase n=1 Tax=Streptomyces sp. BI20 TaxID=3403460 RepID=UPI003C75480D